LFFGLDFLVLGLVVLDLDFWFCFFGSGFSFWFFISFCFRSFGLVSVLDLVLILSFCFFHSGFLFCFLDPVFLWWFSFSFRF
jgi:hypothetical protein